MVISRGSVIPPPDPLPWQSAIAERAGTPVTCQFDAGEVQLFTALALAKAGVIIGMECESLAGPHLWCPVLGVDTGLASGSRRADASQAGGHSRKEGARRTPRKQNRATALAGIVRTPDENGLRVRM